MGNCNPQYPTNTPYPNPLIQNVNGVGVTTQILGQPSYAPGILNAGYYNNFDSCCDCGPTYQPTPSLSTGGYGINPAFSQNTSGDACCGPSQ